MSTDRDTTRIVRSWLRTDEHESADRVLDDVLALLDATPQRRSLWPVRRSPDMNTLAKFAFAAAAVVLIAFAGIRLLPASGGTGGDPAISAPPTPSPTAIPGPSPTPAATFLPSGALAVGTRHQTIGGGVRYSLTVPTSDWISNGSFAIDKAAGIGPDGAGFILWPQESPVGVFADPCAQVKGPALGASAADLAAAVAALPGIDLVSGPADMNVGGYPAKHVVLVVPEDVACDAEDFYLWYAPSAGLARYATELGFKLWVWIVDVDGSIVWIDGETYKGAGPEPELEIQQIVDSIQFE